MKKILFLVLVVFSINVSNLTAQEDESLGLTNEEFFEQADYIVEGKFINGYTNSYDAKGLYQKEDIYSELKFIVKYAYKAKNNLINNNDTITIVFDWGEIYKVDYTEEEWTYESLITKYLGNADYPCYCAMGLESENEQILFLKESDFPDNPKKDNNYFRTKLLRDRKFAKIKYERNSDRSTGLNNLSFDNKYDLYKYMEQFEYLNLPISDPKQMQWELRYDIKSYNRYRKERLGIDIERENTKEYNDSLKNFILERDKKLQQSVKKKALNESKATNDITFSISKQEQSYYSGTHYLDFYIEVSANNSDTYLFYAQPWISYNTTAFGQNIKSNGKLVVTNLLDTKYNEIYVD